MIKLILLVMLSVGVFAQLVGTTKGDFSVEQGNAKYILNMQTPKGVGIKPNLSISYNSSYERNNGFLGQGFTLDFMSAITICDDYYCLDEEKLITAGNSIYELKTEIDSYSKIVSDVRTIDYEDFFDFGPNSLKVYTKDGFLKEYGTSSNSKNEAEFYALTKISDKSGNYIYYNYDSNQNIINIKYANTVIYFNYETRTDKVHTSYTDYVFRSTLKRLKNIVIKTDGEEVSTYSFTYKYINNKSHISSIKQCIGNSCKEALNFTWNNNTNAQVTKISNEQDEQTTIEYVNLENSSIYSNDKNSNGSTTYFSNPNISVVYYYSSLNGQASFSRTYFSKYKNLAVDSKRGGLGFSYIKSNFKSKVREINYKQDFPYIGKIENKTIFLQGNKYKYLENTYENINSYSNVYNPKLTKSVLKTYDINSNGSLLTTKTIENTSFDIFGNIKKIIEKTVGEDNITSTKITTNTYDNNESTWIIGKIIKIISIFSKTGTNDIIRTTLFNYYSNGLLNEKIIEPNDSTYKLTTRYNYNSLGNIIKKTISGSNAETRTETYGYDSKDINQTTVTNSLGHIITKKYNYKNQLESIIDTNNLETSFKYDIFGRKIKETLPTGIYRTWDYTWTSSGYKVIEKMNNKFPLTVYFNKIGKKIKTEKIGFDGRKIYQEFYYHVLGMPYKESLPYYVDETPIYITKVYDVISRIKKITRSSISESETNITNTYDMFQMISIDKKGHKKTTTFDSTGKTIKIEDNLTDIEYKYNSIGDLIETIDSKGNKIVINYDGRGNKINMNDPDMGYWQYKHNVLGELIWQKDAKGQITEFIYDKLGRKTAKKENGVIVGEWYYDSVSSFSFKGKLIWEKSKNKSKVYGYDSFGRLITEYYNLSNDQFSTSGKVKRYKYDNYGRLNYKQLPNGVKLINQYNTYGYLEAVKSIKNSVTSAQQEIFNQTVQEALNMEFAYYKKYLNVLDQISIYQKLINQYKESYSSKEFLELIEELDGYISIYHLQAKVYYERAQEAYENYLEMLNSDWDDDRVESMYEYSFFHRYKDIAEEYVLKAKGEHFDEYLVEIVKLRNKLADFKEYYINLTQYSNPTNIYKISDSIYNYHYKILERDSFNRVTKYIYGNGIITNENYDDKGLLLDSKSGYENDDDFIRSVEFDYDDNRNVVTRHDRRLAVVQNYIYDSLDRVKDVYIDTQGNNTYLEYRYDELGNITYKTGLGVYYYETDGSSKPHAVSRIGSTVYKYDENGNMTSGDGRAITYSYSNKPTIIKKGSTTVTFEYDLNDERIKKISNGITTYYLGKDYEIVQTGSLTEEKAYIYLNGRALAIYNKKISLTTTFETQYLHYDNLGSVDTLTNNLGIVTQRIAYKPFGERLALDKFGDKLEEDLVVNRGFTGHEQIDEVELIHMNGRVYDSKIGRFISADPHIFHVFDTQGFNRYSYARNNPLKYIDPSGYFDFGSDDDFEDPADEWGSDTIGDFSDLADDIGYGDVNDSDNESRSNEGDADYQEFIEKEKEETKTLVEQIVSIITSLPEIVKNTSLSTAAKITGTPAQVGVSVYSIGQAKNKQRETSQVIGSLALGAFGALAGGLFGGPLGAYAGSLYGGLLGARAGANLYDSYQNNKD